MYARAALAGTVALVERWRPDVVVRETMEFASALAAERFGVRQFRFGVHLEAALDGNAGPLALAAPALAALRPAAGLPDGDPLAAIASSEELTLAPASLDAPGAPAVRRYRDPVAAANGSPVWPDADDRRPLVFVAFGSEAARGAYFPPSTAMRSRRSPACRSGCSWRWASGRPDELGPVPGAARVVGWVPQAAAMREAAVFVGHGGSGSTLAALAAGVPQVLLGLFVDGPRNAERVAALGAGIAVRSAGEIGDAVAAVLAGEPYRSAAGRIAAGIAAHPPIDDAVQSL